MLSKLTQATDDGNLLYVLAIGSIKFTLLFPLFVECWLVMVVLEPPSGKVSQI